MNKSDAIKLKTAQDRSRPFKTAQDYLGLPSSVLKIEKISHSPVGRIEMTSMVRPEDALTKEWPETKISYIVCLKGYGYDKTKLLLEDEEEQWFWAFFEVGKKKLKGRLGSIRCNGPDGWVYTLERIGMKTFLARLENEDDE